MNRYEMSVFLACAETHMHLTDSGPHMSDDVMAETTKWLSERLASWVPSKPAAERYDEAVRALIVATLQEVAGSKRKRGK
jgi:hypothetical protein